MSTAPANPFFSVVIPVFNRAHVLGEALASVASQDFRNYEVIIVDDGSTDDVNAVVQQYEHLRISLLRNEVNSGVGHTRNKGIRAAHGDWIILLDSDNRLSPFALSVLRTSIENCDDKVAVVYGKSELIGVDQKLRGDPEKAPTRWGYKQYLSALEIEEALPVVRREVLLRFPFEEGLGTKRECGTLVWYAIGRAGFEFVWTKETIQRYMISSDSLSGRNFISAHPEEMVVCNKKILERFGEDLVRANRSKFVTLQQKTSFYCLMANCRSCAWRHAWTAFQLDPVNARSCALLVLCAFSPRFVRALYPKIAAIA